MSDCVEPMTLKNVDICTCGRVMFRLDADDYDTLGSDSDICCPDCGNEKFQTIAQLKAELEKHRWIPVNERLPEIGQWVLCYWPDKFGTNDNTCEIIEWWDKAINELEEFTHWKPIILPEKEANK